MLGYIAFDCCVLASIHIHFCFISFFGRKRRREGETRPQTFPAARAIYLRYLARSLLIHTEHSLECLGPRRTARECRFVPRPRKHTDAYETLRQRQKSQSPGFEKATVCGGSTHEIARIIFDPMRQGKRKKDEERRKQTLFANVK